MQNNIKTININQRMFQRNQRSAFSRWGLPLLVLISFIWLNLYSTLTQANGLLVDHSMFVSATSYIVTIILFSGVIEYLLFELLFFVYRLFIGFSIYSFLIPKNVMLDKFRLWYIFRNILLGIVFNLRFFIPYISVYLCVFELIFNFAFIIGLYFALSKNYIEPLVGQFVFKTLSIPVFIYEIYIVIKLMVGVL